MVKFKELHLKELYDELVMGQSPSSETYNDEKKGLPFVQGNADMKDGVPKIRIYSTDPKKLSQKGDLLLSVRAPVGDLFKNNIGEIAIGRGLSAIRINDQYLNKYVHHYFSWDKRQFLKLEQGTTFTEIGKREVRNLKILLPENPNEQTAIATLLSKVDEAIEATQNSIKAAEKLKKALMQNLLTGKLKPDGTWRTEDEFYEDEKFGKVPKGWEVKKFRNLTKQITDGVHSTPNYQESGVPFLSVTDLRGNKISFDNCKYISEEEHKFLIRRCKPEIGDVLMGKVATLGVCDIVETEIEFSVFVQIALIKPNDLVDGNFLKFKIQSVDFNNLLYTKAAGTTIKYVGIDSISKIKIILPNSLTEQRNIAKKLSEVDKSLLSKQTKIQTLQRLKKSLMQNLLTGKVRLPEDFIAQFESTVEVNHKIEIA